MTQSEFRHQIINHRSIKLEQHITRLGRTAKPTLGEVRRKHGLTTTQLAETASIPLREVYQAEIGVAIDHIQAIRLLDALNVLSGQQYTLETVLFSLRRIP